MSIIVGREDVKVSRDGDEGLYSVSAFSGTNRELFLGEVQRLPIRGWMAYDRRGRVVGRVFDGRALHATRKHAVTTLIVAHNVKARG